MNRLTLSLCIFLMALFSVTVSAQKKKAASKIPVAVMINFPGGNDVKNMAADSRNVYVSLKWCKFLAVIDKATGAVSKIDSPKEITSVAVANGKCYYHIVSKGIFSYDPATKKSAGPLFGIESPDDSMYSPDMSVSPDGHYLLCDRYVIDLIVGAVVGEVFEGSSVKAVNNLGGVYVGNPEARYFPLGADGYLLTDKVVVHNIFADPVTGNAYFACEQGVGWTPEVPVADAGLKRIKELQEYQVDCVGRDDKDRFVFGLRNGMAIGGVTPEAPLKVYTPLKTGIIQYGMDLKLDHVDRLARDGQGNILAASMNILVIFNPEGVKGYSTIRGKAIQID